MSDASRPQNEHVLRRLREEQMIWLSSVRVDSRPHLVPVWFLWEEEQGTVLIFTEPGNQKVRNLRENPNVMLALDTADEGSDIVMLEGTAELLQDDAITMASVPAYIKKYAEPIADMHQAPEEMAKQYSQAIRITPTRFISWS